MKPSGVITLLTDFGLSDPYVGIMKGVILSINPGVSLVDLTHDIPPGAIAQGAWILQEARPFFPRGTVHLAVVDPGVGSQRRPLALRTREAFFVGPDNGLFSLVTRDLESIEAVHITNEALFLRPVSPTFHGRDVFAPVAAHLSVGERFQGLGPRIQDIASLPLEDIQQRDDILIGRIVRVDRFGNLITNIHQAALFRLLGTRQALVHVGGLTLDGIRRTFSDAREGELLALIDSSGFLAISINRGRACDRIGKGSRESLGQEVLVKPAGVQI